MALVFTTANQAAAVGGVKFLVYGGAGLGKTVLTATLPSPILISAEAGTLSLKRKNLERLFGPNNPHICYDVPLIQVANVDDLTQAYAFCAQAAEAKRFDSIALDSVSEIAEVVLNNAKRQVKDPRQAYGELMEKMETLVRMFRDLPNKHVYFAAKMEPMKDANGVVKFGPSMPGQKLGPQIPYFFDEVFRLGVNKDQKGDTFRFLQTQPDLQYEAKDRSGALASIEFPHLGQVISKILGG